MRNVVTNGRLSKTNVVTKTTASGFETFRAQGVKDALDRLAEMEASLYGSDLKSGLLSAGNTVAEAVRSNAPAPAEETAEKGWPHIKDAVFVAEGPLKFPNVLVGINHIVAPQALWVEYGTGTRTTHAGANRGSMTAKPFWRPALAGVRDNVAQIIGAVILAIVGKAE